MAAAINEKINRNKIPFEMTLDCISIASLDKELKYHKTAPKKAVRPASQVNSVGSSKLIFCLIATKINPVIVVA